MKKRVARDNDNLTNTKRADVSEADQQEFMAQAGRKEARAGVNSMAEEAKITAKEEAQKINDVLGAKLQEIAQKSAQKAQRASQKE